MHLHCLVNRIYDALLAGRSVESAYEFGCSTIQMAGIPEYLIPTLKQKI
jgi:hypothetical protein